MPSCDWGDLNCNCRECREDRQHIKDFSLLCEYWERHKKKFLKVISNLNSKVVKNIPTETNSISLKEYNSHRLYKILQKYQYD